MQTGQVKVKGGWMHLAGEGTPDIVTPYGWIEVKKLGEERTVVIGMIVGLLLNALAGWWWADPVAALLMLPLIVHEGREAIEAARGKGAHDRDE